MKKKIAALMAAVILTLSSGYPVSANASNIYEHITVNSYDPQMDYSKEIELVLKDGGRYAMQVGAVYEKQRNLKIQKLDLDYPETSYFTKYSSAAEILKVMEDEKKPKYSDEDLYWLSRIINSEAGSAWIPDWVQRHVGSVVLNRVKSPKYANSVKGVAFERGQYYCVTSGSIYREPSYKSTQNAIYILENGSTLPDGVLGQSEFVQGRVYTSYHDPYLGTTTYFCYM